MPRTARSRSADGATMAALLPPSSSSSRPNRPATRGATARPMRVEPVALSSATRGSSTSAWPTSAPPSSTADTAAGAPARRAASATSAWQASAVSMVFSDGFQTTASPQTRASAVFHDHTATGKLKALITPTTPSGCHCSIIRWPGRSEAIVRPNSCRDRPTARSQMSIISWTSPRPSERILPASMDTSAPRSALCSRSRLPSSRTSWPRTGPGTVRQVVNASWAAPMIAATSAGVCDRSRASSPPVTGERATRSPSCGTGTPSRPRISVVSASSSACAGSFMGLWLVEVITLVLALRSGRRCWWPAAPPAGCPPGR